MRQEKNIQNHGHNVGLSAVKDPAFMICFPLQDRWLKPEQEYEGSWTAKFQLSQPSLGKFYEEIYNGEKRYDVYGFFPHFFALNKPNVLRTIANKFTQFPECCAIYGDVLYENKLSYLSPFDPKLIPLKVPIFINGLEHPILKFTEQDVVQNLFIQIIQQGFLLMHIAEPLFKNYEQTCRASKASESN